MRGTQAPQVSNLQVVGTAYNAPSSIPMSMLTIGTDGMLTYEALYSFDGPAGQMILARYPGSYGTLYAAGRA